MAYQGSYVDSSYDKDAYKTFKPSSLPVHIDLNNDILNRLIEANRELGKLSSLSYFVPNMNHFISIYARKEAILSSYIEGKNVSFDDAFGVYSSEKMLQNVKKYVDTIQYSIYKMRQNKLDNRFIKDIYAHLNGLQYADFRNKQNWVGFKGSKIKDARYIPPCVEDMKLAINDLEKYILDENADEYDGLIKTALIHYQFETIHPFECGNGEMGRILILLCLLKYKKLEDPLIYISYFLKNNQYEYFDRMDIVRKTGNYEQWIIFFLDSIIAACKDSIETINGLIKLHNKNYDIITHNHRPSDSILQVFDYIENHPMVDIKSISKSLDLAYNTVASCINELIEYKILVPNNANARNRTFSYKEYLDILKSGI